jgi:predicted phage terminase large subunit-like protein
MAKPRTSSKKPKAPPGHLRCVLCGEAKLLTHFPAEEKTCFECLKTPAPTSEIDIEALETTPETSQELSIALPAAEIDYDNPTTAELAARTLCRRNLLQFIKRFRPKYEAGWVHIDICKRLEQFMRDIEAGKEPRLLLMMPVRMGKSEIASRHFAPYILGHHPDWEIIAASGAQSLATSFSRYIRDLLRNDSYQALFPVTALDPQSQSVENWNTTMGGGYLAAGTGTMITGRGAHCLIIDDPVKDAEAADSQLIRDNVWEWYISTALSRLAPGGGVLGILCMTGDTPVLMADGSERRLDSLTASDKVATYANGRLSSSVVKGMRSNGRDSVLRITTSSGKVVRANQRHPFLTVAPDGELIWTRAKNLTTAHKIVTVRGNGGSGKGLCARQETATGKWYAEGIAKATMQRNDGPTDTEARPTLPRDGETPSSSTCTASLKPTTTPSSQHRARSAPSVESRLAADSPSTGSTSPSTTATIQAGYEGFSATTATPESSTLALSPWHLPLPNISDFTLDDVASVQPDGEEEVFDVQVDRTENFIAAGLVSHNTWWNEDDWAGRVQQLSEMEGGDVFEIVKYPAINEQGDEYILTQAPGRPIVQLLPGQTVPDGAVLTRPHNSALHPARYTYEALMRRKKTYYALGQQRWWAALYQQNPTPEEGAYFTKEMFRFFTHRPPAAERNVYQAWDFAITEKAQSDYTVCVTIDQDSMDNLFVVDVTRFRSSDSFVIADAILDCWELHGSCALLGFEDSQIWRSVESVFKKRCEERRLHPAYEVMKPFTDKMVRAQPLRGRMQSGKLMFNQHTAWWDECRMEMLRFPAGKHDDIIDALSWCVRLVLSKVAPRFATKREMKSWKDRLPGLASPKGGAMAA